MLSFFRTKIRNKIVLLSVSMVALLGVFTLVYFPSNKRGELQKVTAEQVTATADLLAFGLGVALDSDKFDAIGEGYALAKRVGGVAYILVYDSRNKFLSGFNPDNVKVEERRSTFSSAPVRNGKYLEKASPIRYKSQQYGTVVVGVSLTPVDTAVRSSFLVLLLGLAIFVAAAIVVSLMFGSRIVAPLAAVRDAMRSLGERDLTRTCAVVSADESAAMAQSVNSAIDSLRESLGAVSRGAERMAAAVASMSSVSGQVAGNAGQMAGKAKAVAAIVSSAAASVGEMSSSAADMSGSVRTVATAIEEMSASLNEVSKNCGNEARIAADASAKAAQARSVMEQLDAAAREITKINDVIGAVADQTNLLALNATIEAASAGEAGRGFAVVAQEVKALARQTADATGQIAKQIEGMQEKTKTAVSVIGAISAVIEEMTSISHSIASAVEQQSVTVSEIARTSSVSSGSAEKISGSVSRWAEQMSRVEADVASVDAAALASVQQSGQIEERARELARLAGELSAVVKQFRIGERSQ